MESICLFGLRCIWPENWVHGASLIWDGGTGVVWFGAVSTSWVMWLVEVGRGKTGSILIKYII